jgi:hypothetical protein
MAIPRDDFNDGAKRTLAARVGNVCSNPDCRALTSGPQDDPAKALNVGVAAHITGAAPGGPRYNASLTADQRCHPDNGIWLCQNCAKIVDNDSQQYPEEVLRAWKTLAEHRARSTIGRTALPAQPESESQRKAHAILEWEGRIVSHSLMYPPKAAIRVGPKMSSSPAQALECTEHYVRISGTNVERSIPLEKIAICYDDANKRLELQERLA